MYDMVDRERGANFNCLDGCCEACSLDPHEVEAVGEGLDVELTGVRGGEGVAVLVGVAGDGDGCAQPEAGGVGDREAEFASVHLSAQWRRRGEQDREEGCENDVPGGDMSPKFPFVMDAQGWDCHSASHMCELCKEYRGFDGRSNRADG